MLVRDELHHGDYEDIRVVEVGEDLDSFLDFLNSGPYGGGNVATRSNRFAVAAYQEFMSTGQTDFGWRRIYREGLRYV